MNKKAYDLTPDELVNSDLSRLASKAGYSSLKSMLNDLSMWSVDLHDVESFLESKNAS